MSALPSIRVPSAKTMKIIEEALADTSHGLGPFDNAEDALNALYAEIDRDLSAETE